MAHNINTYIGRSAAWHTLGTVTGKYNTWDEIQRHGGLDFSPIKEPLYAGDGRRVDAYGVFRSDNHAFLGSVGGGYTPIHHAEGFRMVDALMATADGAHYETAGALGAGETVWGLADLNLTLTVGKADHSKGYLLFATAHNGTMSHSYWLTFTRVVCQNTLRMATRAGASLRVKHTKNAMDRIGDMHTALATMARETHTVEEKLNFLAGRRMTRETMGAVLDRLFPRSKDDDGKPQDSTRRNNILADVLRLYESNDRNAFPEQRGTAYNLLNAVTEYTDHVRSANNGNAGRAESAMFGTGERLKSQAFEILLETANGLPSVPVIQYVAERKPTAPSGLLDKILLAELA